MPHLVNTRSKPDSVVLAEAKAKLRAIEESAGGEQRPFRRITAVELATGRFDLTYLIDGVLVKDQPAGLVAPKKSLKTNIGVDLAISLATGGRFLGYFHVAEPKRPAMFSGESGMATIQETVRGWGRAAGVTHGMPLDVFRSPPPAGWDILLRWGRSAGAVEPANSVLARQIDPSHAFFGSGRLSGHAGLANHRHCAYEPGSGMHRLWFSTGGSAGHSCLMGLDVFEGVFDPGGKPREWNVNVVKPRDVISAEQDRKEEAREQNAEANARARLKRNPAAFGILTDPHPPVLDMIPIDLTSKEAGDIAARVLTIGEEEFGQAESLVREGRTGEAISAFSRLRQEYRGSWIDRVAAERLKTLEEEQERPGR